MGQGVQAGINAYLERRRQQKEGTQNQALIDLRQKELGLNQANASREMDLVADAQARAEQEKRVGGYKKLSDFSDPGKGIFVYEYEELSPGAYVPVSRDKQMLEYQRQFEQYEAREKRLADEQMNRDIAVVKARPGAEKPPEDDLVLRVYDKTGHLNTNIATTVVTRALVPNGTLYDALTLLKGPEGAQRARELARQLGQWAYSTYPGRDTEKDFLTFMAAWSPELAKELFPLPPPPPRTREPDWVPPAPPRTPRPVFQPTAEQLQQAAPVIQQNQQALNQWQDAEMQKDIQTFTAYRNYGQYIKASDVDFVAKRYGVTPERVRANLGNVQVIEGK